MSWILYDPDEWETVVEFQSHGTMFGVPIGSCSYTQRRRPSEEIAAIKAKKQRQREEEILAEAAAITS